jgi:hypothetical protein
MKRLILPCVVFFGLGLLVGFVFLGEVSKPLPSLTWHDGSSLPIHKNPVIYYRLQLNPLNIIVKYSYADENGYWRDWQERESVLPAPDFWASDPMGAR